MTLGYPDAFVAPFVPTPARVVKWLRRQVQHLLPPRGGQPVVYDAGCGNGIVVEALVEPVQGYGVCAELDTLRAREAVRYLRAKRVGHLVDVVIADILSLRLRRVDLAYAFLMPAPMDPLADLLPPETVLVSLDFPTTRRRLATVVPIGSHTVYIYHASGGHVVEEDERSRALHRGS